MAKKSEKHAVIYFDPTSGKEFKELAKRIRAEGATTALVWSSNFRDADSIVPEARAVVIQEGCAFAKRIEEAYRRYAHDVEIHFVSRDGEDFLDPSAPPEPQHDDDNQNDVREDVPSEDATVQDETGASAGEPAEAVASVGEGTDGGPLPTEGEDDAVRASEPDSGGVEI